MPATDPKTSARSDQFSGFEKTWRGRFERFALASDDDAGIAGWSSGGLSARYRRFVELWHTVENVRDTDGSWLDAGCGAGTYARFLADQNLHVTGVDYSVPTARKAHQRSAGRMSVAAADVTQLPFGDGCFAGVVCFGVMQALASPHRALGELHRVLQPGGVLWVDALNASCLPSWVAEQARGIRRRPRHLRYDLPRTFRAALAAGGFSAINVFWVPIMPSGLQVLQPVVESRIVQRLLRSMPTLGALASHSLLVRAVSA